MHRIEPSGILLYVGSDSNLLNSLKEMNGFIIRHEENSLMAIGQFDGKNKVEVIICEVNLPGLNGLDFFNKLKQFHAYNEQPFILVHNAHDDQLANKAIKSGIHDFYIKPVEIEKLSKRILFLLGNTQSNRKTNDTPNRRQNVYKIPTVKRIFDIIASGMGLLILSPLFLIIAVMIKIESKGPIFYTSKRVGTGYRIFDFFKLRSMYTGADLQLRSLSHKNQYVTTEVDSTLQPVSASCPDCSTKGSFCSTPLFIDGQTICEKEYLRQKKNQNQSTFVKILNDPRVTRVGRFIRKTSIDELPQLFNVFRGDMSVVGNRPLPLYEAELLTSDEWGERFLGPAGITGLWQVSKRGKKNMSEEERKQLDNQYARDYSFLGDIKIILRTIPALLQKEDV